MTTELKLTTKRCVRATVTYSRNGVAKVARTFDDQCPSLMLLIVSLMAQQVDFTVDYTEGDGYSCT